MSSIDSVLKLRHPALDAIYACKFNINRNVLALTGFEMYDNIKIKVLTKAHLNHFQCNCARKLGQKKHEHYIDISVYLVLLLCFHAT